MAYYITSHETLFIHIPKTGGTSIFNWIEENLDCKKQGPKHATINQYRKSFGEIENYFSIIRHPIDRLLSWYHYQYKMILYREQKNKPKPNDIEIKNLYLKGFNESFTGTPNALFDKTILRPQINYFNKDEILFLIKYENINQDFKKIQNFFNCFKPLPFKNSSKNKIVKTKINKETLNIIYDVYQKDFEQLGYEYEAPENDSYI